MERNTKFNPEPKPRRTGTWVRIAGEWYYTATPELHDVQDMRQFAPAHMSIG